MEDFDARLFPAPKKLLERWFFGSYIVFATDALAAREIHQRARGKTAARGSEVLEDGRAGYWIRWRGDMPDVSDA